MTGSVGIVMLLSASGKAEILSLFGMSVGTSVAVINYISKIFSPIESLGMEIQTIQSAMAGVKRIDAFLEQPERTIPTESDNETRGDIVFSHVMFGYGGKPALNDFSMTVKEGEQVTLVGRTGAGKSTVFRLLMGLYQPEAGRITIGGVDVSEITDSERRTCIGCVEQHFSRVPGMVLEQITLGDLQITEEMAQKAAELAGIDEAIRALPDGYHTNLYRRNVFTGRMAAFVDCPCRSGGPGSASSGRNHRQSGCGDRSARAGRIAPCLRRSYRAVHFSPHL